MPVIDGHAKAGGEIVIKREEEGDGVKAAGDNRADGAKGEPGIIAPLQFVEGVLIQGFRFSCHDAPR